MSPDPWAKLAEPFPDEEVKHRPGAATWEHKADCQGPRCRETRDASKHMQFSYVDARAVAQRLDDVVTPAGWEFTCSVIPGSDVVKGTLTVHGVVREDHGYPNSERDEEPIKAATSDALKRCAVLFGIGRHLYEDNKPGHGNGRAKAPVRALPARSSTAMPEMPEFPDDFGEPVQLTSQPFQPIGAPQPKPLEQCPDHPGEVWRGTAGDLYHKMPDGTGYCRPEGQPKKAKAR